MPSVTIRIADSMRTKGYLPSQRAELRLELKSRLASLLLDDELPSLSVIPPQRASTHESIWLSEAQAQRAISLGQSNALSVGESITAILLRDFDGWCTRQPAPLAPTSAPTVDAGALGRALARDNKQPRKEQLEVLKTMRSLNHRSDAPDQLTGQVLFCEAGTGTGKTLAYLAAAVELLQSEPSSRVMIAAPTFALIQQIGTELATFADEAPAAVFLAGQSEWISETALLRFLDEKENDLPLDQAGALRHWMNRGGDGSRPYWSSASLLDAVPAFEFLCDVTVARRLDKDDRGHSAYVAQFAKAADARIVVLTHAMLGWLVKQRMIAQFRASKGSEKFSEAIASWKATPASAREQKFHEMLNHALADEESDAGCDRLPDVDWLIVDEAHSLEDAFANVFSVDGSLGALLRDASDLHREFATTFPRHGLDRLRDVFNGLKDMSRGNGADDIVNLAEMREVLDEVVTALQESIKPKTGASKRHASAASCTRQAKRIKATADALALTSEAVSKGATWAAAYLHWSPTREYPRISVGKLWLNQEFHYLWSIVTKRTALVSGTLYEEIPTYSCETIRRGLSVSVPSVVQMTPIHARWQIDPVELRMAQPVHAADGRPRFYRPASKLEAVERSTLGQRWLDDVSGYVAELMRLNATAGGVLVLGTAFSDIEGVQARLRSGTGVASGWILLVQRPGVGLAGLRKEFLEASKTGKVILLAVGGAWTGFDLHAPETPDALTDLVILNAPFGLMGKTVSRLRRQANKGGHFEVSAHALLLVRQGVGRLVRSPETHHNRRIHWLDSRIFDPSLSGMFYSIKRFLGRYRTLAVA